MDKTQAETLDIVQSVLRCVVMSFGALAPEKLGALSTTLAAHSQAPGLHPAARRMLQDLAQGPAMVDAARQRQQGPH